MHSRMRQKHYTGLMLRAKQSQNRSDRAQTPFGRLTNMMKHIVKAGAVSAALAAAALLTSNAYADTNRNQPDRQKERSVSNEMKRTGYSAYENRGPQSDSRTPRGRDNQNWNRNNDRNDTRFGRNGPQNSWGSERYEYGRGHHARISGYERKKAIRSCARAIQYKTDRAFPGPSGRAYFVGRPSVERGRYGKIRVSAPVKLEARRIRTTLPASCEIRNGHVVDLNYSPKRVARKHSQNRYGWSFGNWPRR